MSLKPGLRSLVQIDSKGFPLNPYTLGRAPTGAGVQGIKTRE